MIANIYYCYNYILYVATNIIIDTFIHLYKNYIIYIYIKKQYIIIAVAPIPWKLGENMGLGLWEIWLTALIPLLIEICDLR